MTGNKAYDSVIRDYVHLQHADCRDSASMARETHVVHACPYCYLPGQLVWCLTVSASHRHCTQPVFDSTSHGTPIHIALLHLTSHACHYITVTREWENVQVSLDLISFPRICVVWPGQKIIDPGFPGEIRPLEEHRHGLPSGTSILDVRSGLPEVVSSVLGWMACIWGRIQEQYSITRPSW